MAKDRKCQMSNVKCQTVGFFNKNLFSLSGQPFGMDIGDLSVKVFHLEKNGKYQKILGYNSSSIPGGSIVDGDIINEEAVVKAIKGAVSGTKPKKISSKEVICSLPETKSFLRIVNMPQMEKREVAEAIKWEIEANIPLPLDQVYYDWQILEKKFSKEQGKISVLVVAVARKTVDQYIAAIEKAGFRIVNIEIESIAQARSLLNDKEKEGTAMIIDIGDRRTTFLVAVEGAPCFTSSIPIAGVTLTEAIAKYCNISSEEAEKMKINFGIGSPYKNENIFNGVKPVLDNMVSEIKKTIDFFTGGMGYSSAIERLIICGGGANTKGIIPYISKNLGMNIEVGNPWANLNFKKSLPIIDKDSAAGYATVVGLAIKGINYECLS